MNHLANQIREHLRTLPPHVKGRKTGSLLSKAAEEIERLRKQCQVADRTIVHYEQMCVRLKQLCGGDVTKHDVSDTENVVRRKAERLRAAIRKLRTTAWDVFLREREMLNCPEEIRRDLERQWNEDTDALVAEEEKDGRI